MLYGVGVHVHDSSAQRCSRGQPSCRQPVDGASWLFLVPLQAASSVRRRVLLEPQLYALAGYDTCEEDNPSHLVATCDLFEPREHTGHKGEALKRPPSSAAAVIRIPSRSVTGSTLSTR